MADSSNFNNKENLYNFWYFDFSTDSRAQTSGIVGIDISVSKDCSGQNNLIYWESLEKFHPLIISYTQGFTVNYLFHIGVVEIRTLQE